jgi:hypothetical protein
MKKKLISKLFSFFAGVVDTADKHSFANISSNFCKKFEMVLMGYSGARGKLIYEEKLMSKISCQTPLKGMIDKVDMATKLFSVQVHLFHSIII